MRESIEDSPDLEGGLINLRFIVECPHVYLRLIESVQAELLPYFVQVIDIVPLLKCIRLFAGNYVSVVKVYFYYSVLFV
jgi:hypothetical protein